MATDGHKDGLNQQQSHMHTARFPNRKNREVLAGYQAMQTPDQGALALRIRFHLHPPRATTLPEANPVAVGLLAAA